MAPTVLARVNFPLYTVKSLSPRHLLVGGGGGSARTGISNCIEIYELSYNGTKCCARPASRYSLGDNACMNCTSWFNGKYHVLAAGLDGDCQVYQVQYKVVEPGEGASLAEGNVDESEAGESLRQRRRSSQKPAESKDVADQNSNSVVNQVSFDFQPLSRFQTDFPTNEDPCQKVVRVSLDGQYLVTGGYDGHVRIWKYPELTMHKVIKAHGKEVDDLDIHPNGKKLASVSRDGHFYLWSIRDGAQVGEFKWDPPNGLKYRHRNCRFGITEQDKEKSKLFSVYVPVTRQKKALSYLIKWNVSKFVGEKVQTMEDASSLAVSDDGRFVAAGSMSGAVSIFISFSLQRIYHVSNAHSFFVTGLEFIPSSEDNLSIVGDQDTSLVSISLDNRIQIHSISKPATISIRIFCYIMFLLLFLTFTFMNYIGL